jgi:hypothetical protein
MTEAVVIQPKQADVQLTFGSRDTIQEPQWAPQGAFLSETDEFNHTVTTRSTGGRENATQSR